MTQAAIVIPGIMGSVLTRNGKVIWPGSAAEILLPYSHFDDLKKLDVEAVDVIRTVSISNVYLSLLDDLEACDFREKAEADVPQTLFLCPYDWRRDNALAAERLAELVEHVSGRFPDGVEITLIAHSMGGLVSRYYLESGKFNGRGGFDKIKLLVTMGTPHRGSPLALTAALGQEKRVFLNAKQVQEIASMPEFPSLYQLLPPPGEPFAWNEDEKWTPLDVYDAAAGADLGLVAANVQAAKDFHSQLDPARRPAGVRYFFFAGTRMPTPSQSALRETGGMPKYRVRNRELEDAGDGTVPAWSGSITGFQCQLTGGEHSTIFRHGVLRQTLGILLGKKGVLAAPRSREVTISIRDRVVTPNTDVRLTIGFAAASSLNGTLVVERAMVTEEGVAIGETVRSEDIVYEGSRAESLSLRLQAPSLAGAYRVSFRHKDSADIAGSDELLVQVA